MSPSSLFRALYAALSAPAASGWGVAARAVSVGLWTAVAQLALLTAIFPETALSLRWLGAQTTALTAALVTAAQGVAALRQRRRQPQSPPPPPSPPRGVVHVGWTLIVLAGAAGFWVLGRVLLGAG